MRRISTSASRPVASIDPSTLTVDWGSVAQREPLCSGLNHHHADAVRDHVVELACDPGAFLRDREPGGLLLLALELLRSRLEDAGELLAVAVEPPSEPDADEERAENDQVACLDRQGRREHERQPGDGTRASRVGRCGVGGERESEER